MNEDLPNPSGGEWGRTDARSLHLDVCGLLPGLKGFFSNTIKHLHRSIEKATVRPPLNQSASALLCLPGPKRTILLIEGPRLALNPYENTGEILMDMNLSINTQLTGTTLLMSYSPDQPLKS